MVRVPSFVQIIFNKAVWRVKTPQKEVFLTFDDGPSESTETILRILKEYNVPATFFYLGDNIDKKGIIRENSVLIANHGKSHLNGLKTPNKVYFENVYQNTKVNAPNVFRPPYGKLRFSQYQTLRKSHKIIMWSILSYDYNLQLSDKKITDNVINNLHQGAIIVMHDQDKLQNRLSNILPQIIEKTKAKGYTFGDLAKYI